MKWTRSLTKNRAYEVKLEAFEGPLDLLLHLINRMEIDIYDIPVADITNQYMHYIHAMQQFELIIACENLSMTETIILTKRTMLIPSQKIDVKCERKKKLETSTENNIQQEKSDLVYVLDLIDALHHFVVRKKEKAPITSTVKRVDISVEDRKKEVLQMLTKKHTVFTALFPYHDRQHIVVTFLAILQLLKSNDIYCQQKGQFEPIYVSKLGASE